MAKRNSLYGRKKSTFLKIVMGITIMMSLFTMAISASLVVININIHRSQKTVVEMKNSMTSLENELSSVKDQEKEYRSQVEKLQQELSQYEPIIIPDSMKTNN